MKANQKFKEETRAEVSPSWLIGLGIAVIILASVLPSALDAFYSADTGNWTIDGQEDTKTTTIWYLLPLIVIAVVVMKIWGGL